MFFRQFFAFLLAIILCCWSFPALADFSPPLSFSGGNIKNKDFSGQNLQTAEFAGTNMRNISFEGANLQGSVFSTSIMTQVNLHGADLTLAMVDQVQIIDSDLSDAVFTDALMLRTFFKNVNIAGADFSNTILDGKQVQILCKMASGVNSKTGVATRDSLGCR